MTTFSINNTLRDIDIMITHEPFHHNVEDDSLKPPMIRRQPAFSDSDLLTSKRVVIRKNALHNKRIMLTIKKNM